MDTKIIDQEQPAQKKTQTQQNSWKRNLSEVF